MAVIPSGMTTGGGEAQEHEEETAIETLDRIYPVRYGSANLVGLGSFILNITQNPGDPETDAENIAIAVLSATMQ